VEESELEWVRRAQAGDPVAVERLIRSQWQRVQRLLIRVYGPRQDLEDLVQNTFLETLRALPSFRHESSLSTFVAGVALRVGRRAQRPSMVQRHSRALGEADDIASAAPDADRQTDAAEALRRVRAILERIAEPKRVAFLLWAVEGMPVDDIALAMQASRPATRSRIFYAQKELNAVASADPLLQQWLVRPPA
jgi:RNA polymerase sigma-70 factor (ECF subfamily)